MCYNGGGNIREMFCVYQSCNSCKALKIERTPLGEVCVEPVDGCGAVRVIPAVREDISCVLRYRISVTATGVSPCEECPKPKIQFDFSNCAKQRGIDILGRQVSGAPLKSYDGVRVCGGR